MNLKIHLYSDSKLDAYRFLVFPWVKSEVEEEEQWVLVEIFEDEEAHDLIRYLFFSKVNEI